MVGKVSHLEGLRRKPPEVDDRRAGCGVQNLKRVSKTALRLAKNAETKTGAEARDGGKSDFRGF
jgi:hypothetical protein